MVLVLLTSLNCYMSILHLVHYTLLLTPAYWKSSNTHARLMAFALPLALDPTFGIHSHRTSDTGQPCHLFKPKWKPSSSHSISAPTNINTQFLLQSVCACVKLQAPVYDILPSTTAVFSYAIGSRKLSANEQFFAGAQTVVSLLQTTQLKQGMSFIAANKVYTSTNKTTIIWIVTELFFYPGWMCLMFTCMLWR